MRTNLGQAEDRKRTYKGPHRQKVQFYQLFYRFRSQLGLKIHFLCGLYSSCLPNLMFLSHTGSFLIFLLLIFIFWRFHSLVLLIYKQRNCVVMNEWTGSHYWKSIVSVYISLLPTQVILGKNTSNDLHLHSLCLVIFL